MDSMMDDDYRAQNDAHTLHTAQEIAADPKRHKAASKHLAVSAEAAVAAHKAARKHLEKRVKARLKQTFAAKPDGERNPTKDPQRPLQAAEDEPPESEKC